jgi:hypothetical protein
MGFWGRRYIYWGCVADRRLLRPKFLASRGAGTPDSRPWPRGRHGVAGASIGLEKSLAPFGTRWCEPIFAPGPQIIGAAMRGAGGDALMFGLLFAVLWIINFLCITVHIVLSHFRCMHDQESRRK